MIDLRQCSRPELDPLGLVIGVVKSSGVFPALQTGFVVILSWKVIADEAALMV